MISVPNVLQSSLAAARKIIIEVGLTIGTVNPSEAADESIVIDQSPPAGRDVERGSAVDLVTQEKSQKVAVPNLLERRLPEAKEILAQVQSEGRHDQSRGRTCHQLCDKTVTVCRCPSGPRNIGRPRSEAAECRSGTRIYSSHGRTA